MHRILLITSLFIFFFSSNVFAATEVVSTFMYQHPSSKVISYSGEIELPFQGYWKIAASGKPAVAGELYLSRDYKSVQKEYPEYFQSKLVLQMEQERKIQTGSSLLRSFYSTLEKYAAQHDFTGPALLDDLDPIKDKRMIELNKKTWTKRFDEKLTGEFAFLVPGVAFEPDKKLRRRLPHSKRKPLMIELRPYVDDGKHWILYNDGSVEREKIDPELVKEYGVTIQPILPGDKPAAKPPKLQKYTVVMTCREDSAKPVSFTVENSVTGEVEEIQWNLANASIDKTAVLENLNHARLAVWRSYTSFGSPPVLTSWLQFFRGDTGRSRSRGNGRNNQGNELTAFNILGGRAAVEETLQMQTIGQVPVKAEERNIPVESLTGVEVESHPFAEMLQNRGGSIPGLPLTELAPHDHFFVHVAKPSTLLGFLEDGTDFISRFGGVMNSNNVEYDLTAKYLSRLGLDNTWLKRFLESGEVQEMALIFPDLFFIDGTEVTTISRLAHPKPVKLLLQLIGVKDLSSGNVVEHDLENGQKVFWTLLDNLLVCSSSKTEMDRVIALHQANGEGSLGKSDEFRYMLTQLSPEKETRLYAYISDPFIRRLVSPATKISQLRRVAARQDMEMLVSRALLAQMDGIDNYDSLEVLAAEKYLPDSFDQGEYSIDQDLHVHSKNYGSLPAMNSLERVPVTMVTKTEADAYKRYVDNYNRFWRRYFDPIAIRINDSKDGSLEMTTFILPLIDNSIYNGLREMLASNEDGEALQVPQPDIKPVVMLSLNLQEKGWMQALQGAANYISPRILDNLEPRIHLAIHDSDPIIATGSGDILGAFNGSMIAGGRGGMMMYIPIALSVLTRPCTLFIETSDPDAVLTGLKGMARRFMRQEFFTMDFYQVEGKDEWTMALDIFGMIKLRYGVEVQGDYLMIRNIPWTGKEKVSGERKAPLKSAFLETFPQACKKQLPGIFTAANENARASAQKNIGYLYPLLASGYATIDDVEQKHFDIFGFRPAHPQGDKWQWDGTNLASTRYGSVFSQKQPGFQEDNDDIGLLSTFDNISLNMQFEDSGLRAILRWKTIDE